jgi:hypothetical protein
MNYFGFGGPEGRGVYQATVLAVDEGYPPPILFQERFVQSAAPPHLVHVRGNHRGTGWMGGRSLALRDSPAPVRAIPRNRY